MRSRQSRRSSAPRLASASGSIAPRSCSTTSEKKEFTDLDIPGGFGPDPEFEALARRGLARVYWTYELGVAEMKEEIADIPVQGVREAVEIAREWSNGKTFQIAVHTMRGNLTPVEAGKALSNVAEASIVAVLSAVEEDFIGRATRAGIATVVLGDLATGEAAPGSEIDVLFLYGDDPPRHHESLCREFLRALRELARDNLLLAHASGGRTEKSVRSLADFREHHRSAGTSAELLDLIRARCVYTSGDDDLSERFEEARQEALTHGAARDSLVAALREPPGTRPRPGSRRSRKCAGACAMWSASRGPCTWHVPRTPPPSRLPPPLRSSRPPLRRD